MGFGVSFEIPDKGMEKVKGQGGGGGRRERMMVCSRCLMHSATYEMENISKSNLSSWTRRPPPTNVDTKHICEPTPYCNITKCWNIFQHYCHLSNEIYIMFKHNLNTKFLCVRNQNTLCTMKLEHWGRFRIKNRNYLPAVLIKYTATPPKTHVIHSTADRTIRYC